MLVIFTTLFLLSLINSVFVPSFAGCDDKASYIQLIQGSKAEVIWLILKKVAILWVQRQLEPEDSYFPETSCWDQWRKWPTSPSYTRVCNLDRFGAFWCEKAFEIIFIALGIVHVLSNARLKMLPKVNRSVVNHTKGGGVHFCIKLKGNRRFSSLFSILGFKRLNNKSNKDKQDV